MTMGFGGIAMTRLEDKKAAVSPNFAHFEQQLASVHCGALSEGMRAEKSVAG